MDKKPDIVIVTKGGIWKVLAILSTVFCLFLAVVLVLNNGIHTAMRENASRLNLSLFQIATALQQENEYMSEMISKYEIARNNANCQIAELYEANLQLMQDKRYADLLSAAKYDDADEFARNLVLIIADDSERWDFDHKGMCQNSDGSLLMCFARKGPDIERLAFVAYDEQVIMDWDKLSQQQLDTILTTLLEKIEEDKERDQLFWESRPAEKARELLLI